MTTKEKMIKVPYQFPNVEVEYSMYSTRDNSVHTIPVFRTIEVPESIYSKWITDGDDVGWNAYAMAFRGEK